jgi:hypothetical protein
MGGVCCSPSVSSAAVEVSEQPMDISDALQAGLSQKPITAKGKGKDKGKGKGEGDHSAAIEAPQFAKGKGKGHSIVASPSSPEVASKSKPCPICKTPGHTARDCPEKGKKKESSASSISDDMVASLVKIYEACGGDAERIADACNCSAEKLRRDPPTDAGDFALKLVAGKYNIPSKRGTSHGWSAGSTMGGA